MCLLSVVGLIGSEGWGSGQWHHMSPVSPGVRVLRLQPAGSVVYSPLAVLSPLAGIVTPMGTLRVVTTVTGLTILLGGHNKCVYIYIHIHTHTHIYISHTHTHTYIYIYIYIYIVHRVCYCLGPAV